MVPGNPAGVPQLSHLEAKDFVLKHGGVKAVYASNAEEDTFWFARMEPSELIWQTRRGPQQMVIRTRDNCLVAITDASVGYGGIGPGYASDLLTSVGVENEIVRNIVQSRVSVVDLDAPKQAMHTFRYPYFNLPFPELRDGKWVVCLKGQDVESPELDDLSNEQAHKQSSGGFHPTPHGTSSFKNWLRLLEAPNRPDWLQGARTVDVFTTSDACRMNGMNIDYTGMLRQENVGVYPVRVTQGLVETWISYRPESEGVFAATDALNPMARKVLAAVGVNGRSLEKIDPSPRFLRFIGRTLLRLPHNEVYY
ncbi:hypothetical protein [Arthrobacter sp. UYCu723]